LAVNSYPNADLASHITRFVAKCRAKGYRYRNIAAAWRSWLIDDMKSEADRGPGGARSATSPFGQKAQAAQTRFNVWGQAAAQPTPPYAH
jgi:hypothetical protein